MRILRAAALVGAVSFACSGGSAGGNGGNGGNGGGGLECNEENLLAQCPPGSMPLLQDEACAGVASGEVADPNGAITGICRGAGADCLVYCNFVNPCMCGIDRINSEGVFCTDCRTVASCGDGLCEAPETPQLCPSDCAMECSPGFSRCNGDDREVCDGMGSFDLVECRSDQGCTELLAGDRSYCRTKVTPSGGTYPGVGSLPHSVTGNPLDIRFKRNDLCTGCIGIGFFDDDQQILATDRSVLQFVDTTAFTSMPTSHRGTLPIAATTRRVAIGDRQPQVVDYIGGSARTMAEYVDDATSVDMVSVTLSADGSLVASGQTVETDPIVAVWNADTGETISLLRFIDFDIMEMGQSPPSALAFSPNGSMLASGREPSANFQQSSMDFVVLWNVEEERFIALLQTDLPSIAGVAFRPSGQPHLAVWGGGLELWDVEQQTRIWRRDDLDGSAAAFSPDGIAIAVTTSGGLVIVDAQTGTDSQTFAAGSTNANPTRIIAFSAAGDLLVVDDEVFADTF